MCIGWYSFSFVAKLEHMKYQKGTGLNEFLSGKRKPAKITYVSVGIFQNERRRERERGRERKKGEWEMMAMCVWKKGYNMSGQTCLNKRLSHIHRIIT